MKILTVCNNINAFLIVYQSFLKKGYEFDLLARKSIEENDVLVYMEASPINHQETMNCKVINRTCFKNGYLSKYKQYKAIKEAGLNCIPTYTQFEWDNIDEREKDKPFISKPEFGTQGKGVAWADKSLSKRFTTNNIYQPYIPNEGDWRIVVIDGKAVSSFKKKGTGLTNNIANWSYAWTNYDEEAMNLAEKCAVALGAEVVGIDIIKNSGTGEYFFLESNLTATFEASQLLTGVDIADIFTNYVIRKYSNKTNWSVGFEFNRSK